MNLLKINNIKLDKSHDSCIIHDLNNIEFIINTFNYTISKKKKCLVTDNSIIIPKLLHDITVVYKSKIYYLSWVNLIIINDIIYKKYSLNTHFNITPSIFNIFYLKLIDKNINYLKDKSKPLIGSQNSHFGIYNSYDDCIRNVDNSLYFSFGMFTFILYRVKETTNNIYGKLFPIITIKNNNIIYNKQVFKCPDSFVKLKQHVYGIKKKVVVFDMMEKQSITCHNLNKKLENFYLTNIVHNTYIIKINKTINNIILQNLYKFIIASYPFLDNHNNKVIYNSEKYDYPKSILNLFITTIKNKKHIIIQIDNRYIAQISLILTSITNYLQTLSSLDKVNVIPRTIDYNYNDMMIHLVSEIYYIIVSLVIYLPNIIKKFTKIQSVIYTHANYIFSDKEVKTMYKHKHEVFTDNLVYLQNILIKTLSIFTYDYYVIMRTNNNIDIIPIKQNMSNDVILNYLQRSNKAELSKTLIWNTTSNIFNYIKSDSIEFPYIIINIDKLDNSCIQSTSKVYTKCFSSSVPIFINVLYNEDNLHISISYKKEHENFKNAFDNIINQLVK
jgi:hypothetical protein